MLPQSWKHGTQPMESTVTARLAPERRRRSPPGRSPMKANVVPGSRMLLRHYQQQEDEAEQALGPGTEQLSQAAGISAILFGHYEEVAGQQAAEEDEREDADRLDDAHGDNNERQALAFALAHGAAAGGADEALHPG